MPKIFLTSNERLSERFTAWIYGQMKVKGLNQTQLAEKMGMSQQRLNYKLRSQSFTYRDFLNLIDILNPESSEVLWLIGGKDK